MSEKHTTEILHIVEHQGDDTLPKFGVWKNDGGHRLYHSTERVALFDKLGGMTALAVNFFIRYRQSRQGLGKPVVRKTRIVRCRSTDEGAYYVTAIDLKKWSRGRRVKEVRP